MTKEVEMEPTESARGLKDKAAIAVNDEDLEAGKANKKAPAKIKQENESKDEAKKKCDWKYWSIRLVIIAVLVLIIVLIVVYREWVSETSTSFLEWLSENPALGTVCLALIYILATLLFIPGSLLTLGAGVALQAALENTALAVLVGTLGVFVGAWIGSNIAMLIGRYLFRSSAAKMAEKFRIIHAIDKVLEKEGLKFTFLLRLCPLIPFNAFNYVMGVTSVQFKHYAIGGFGMIPGTAVYVFVGTTIGNIADAASGDFEGGTVTLVLLIVGTILAFVAIIYVTCVVRKYLNKQLNQEPNVSPEPSEKYETTDPDAKDNQVKDI